MIHMCEMDSARPPDISFHFLHTPGRGPLQVETRILCPTSISSPTPPQTSTSTKRPPLLATTCLCSTQIVQLALPLRRCAEHTTYHQNLQFPHPPVSDKNCTSPSFPWSSDVDGDGHGHGDGDGDGSWYAVSRVRRADLSLPHCHSSPSHDTYASDPFHVHKFIPAGSIKISIFALFFLTAPLICLVAAAVVHTIALSV